MRADIAWDDHYHLWRDARRQKGDAHHQQMLAARKLVATNTAEGWEWLAESLNHPRRKWFVACVFEKQPVPRRLLAGMLRAGVLESNPSSNRLFIKPCVRSFGGLRVNRVLLQYLRSGTDEEKAGAARALYWARENPRNEDLESIELQLRDQFLREFVANNDLRVSQAILPMLILQEDAYSAELRPLVSQAVDFARKHDDKYIRHRVEVQLGADMPYMPMPTSEGT